jgi:hypothetical protein
MYVKKKITKKKKIFLSKNNETYNSPLLQPFYCPIPDDQKPINIYIEQKENSFFNILNKIFFIKNRTNEFKYKNKFLIFSILFILIVLIKFFGVIFFIQIIFLYLVNIWLNLARNFKKARIFYEESSWFDGQYWDKKYFLIKNDILINNQKVKPIIKNLVKKFLLFSFLFAFIQLS